MRRYDVRLRLATPTDYTRSSLLLAALVAVVGGVAIIYRRHMKCRCRRVSRSQTHLTTSSGPIVLLNIYRPGSARPRRPSMTNYVLSSRPTHYFSYPVLVGVDKTPVPTAMRRRLTVDTDWLLACTSPLRPLWTSLYRGQWVDSAWLRF